MTSDIAHMLALPIKPVKRTTETFFFLFFKVKMLRKLKLEMCNFDLKCPFLMTPVLYFMNLLYSVCRYSFIRQVFGIFSRHYMAKILSYWVKHLPINHHNISMWFVCSKICHRMQVICRNGQNIFI